MLPLMTLHSYKITWTTFMRMSRFRVTLSTATPSVTKDRQIAQTERLNGRRYALVLGFPLTAPVVMDIPSTVFITEGGVKKWHGGSIPINTHRKCLLDGCDDWVVSADLPEWERHPDVIRKTALRPDIVIHSASTQQIIMVELTVPYESRMEENHAFKEGKYLDLTKELKKDGYEAKVMPVEIGARGFVGSSAYGLLSKLSIGGNKRTKALRLLAETAENSSRWIWSRRNERLLHKD
ncbi:reverse transcriptase [Plakobranchus ocellatus]|uniref:Reverse transcriptase n=1 Tax=Plakobranchus ocellatus TaxID=259542 RepID=A0AAV4AW01_9GAST|nr:reverse transcriptase [Plakobranchus ocellatus]